MCFSKRVHGLFLYAFIYMTTEAHTDAVTLMSVLGHADPKTIRRHPHVIHENVRKLAAVDIFVTSKVLKPIEK